MPNNTKAQKIAFASNHVGDRYIPDLYPSSLIVKEYDEIWRASFAPISYEKDHSYVFTGTDSGLLIKAFAKNHKTTPLSLIFIEDASIIDSVREECASELAELSFTQLMTIAEFKESIEMRDYDTVLIAGKMCAIKSASVAFDNSGKYKAIDEQVHFLLNAQHHAVLNTVARLPFLQQRLLNTPELKVPATILNDRFQQQTVVVLAAGPSLDAHINWVKANRSKLILVSVSRLSKRLQLAGITPDIVTIIDPHSISYEVSHEALNFKPAPVLAFSDQAVSQIVGQWNGPKVYIGSRLAWRFESFEIGTNAPTVSNLAFDIAKISKPRQIILLGLDFCMDESGHTHATGSIERDKGVSLSTDMEEVQTYDGSIRLSTTGYYRSAKALEQQIQSSEGIKVINPSGGSMKLSGVLHMPLSDVELEEESSVEKTVQDLRLEIQELEENSTWVSDALKQTRQFSTKFAEFRALALDGKKTVTAAKANRITMQKCDSKLNKIDYRISHKFLEQRSFCTVNAGHFFADILDTGVKQTADESAADALDDSANIYSAYLKSVKSLKVVLDISKDLLRIRQATADPIWSQELVDHLLEFGLPRKILQTSAELPEGALAAAEDLDIKQREAKTQRLQEAIDDMEANHSNIFAALNGAYSQQSIDKLTHFRNVVAAMTDFAQHELYSQLADAYLAEIKDEPAAALNSYQAIIDIGESPLLEEALNRLAFLCIRLGDTQTALTTLTVLCNINPMYKSTLDQLKKVA